MRRHRCAVLAVVVTMLFASSCSETQPSGSGTAITFNIGVEDSELPAIEELLRRFQQTTGAKVSLSLFARGRNRPGPRINLSRLNADDMTSALKENGSGIDLIAVDNTSLGRLLKDDLVQPLPDVRVPEQVDPVMRQGVHLAEGRPCEQFFLPFRPNVRLTYVRKAALSEAGIARPPETLEEFEDAARRLPDVLLSLAPGEATGVTVAEWIVAHGGQLLDLGHPRSIAALDHLARLWRQGIFSRASLGARYDTEIAYLLSGHSDLAQNWTFTSAKLAEAGKLHEFRVHHGWSGPKPEARVEPEARVIGGDVLAIPKQVQGAQKEAAVALARFLMSKEAQAYLVRENAWPSIRSDAYGSVTQDETFQAIQAALARGFFRPPVAYWDQVVDKMNDAVDRILQKGEDASSVMKELQGELDRNRDPSKPDPEFCRR